MRNIIRADLYRIFRGKGVYIATAVFLVFIITIIATNGMGTIGVDIHVFQNPDELDDYAEGLTVREEVKMTGKIAPIILADGTSDIIYFILPFIVIIAAADFSKGTAKNLISAGESRLKYYIAKLILIGFACIVTVVTFVVLSILITTLMNGFGGSFDMEFVKEVAKIYLPQLYLIFAYSCIGLFVVFTLKSTASLISIYVAFAIVPTILIMIAQDINERVVDLMKYDLVFNMKTYAYPDGAFPPDLTRTLILGGVFILVCTVGGFLLFRKAELK